MKNSEKNNINSKMLKRLRIQFVLIALAAIVVMQSVIIYISINRVYNKMVSKSDVLAEVVYKNSQNSEEIDSSDIDARYFYVILDENNNVKSINNTCNRSVRPKQAVKYYRDVLLQNKIAGFYNGYRYKIYNDGNSVTAVFILRQGQISDVKKTAKYLIMASLTGVAAMFVLLIFISRKMVMPIARSYQKQKEFITSASHELKTPLTVIMADVDILRMDNENNEWLNDIKVQAENLTEMTNSLVSLARMEERSGRIVKVEFPISELAEDVTHSYNAVAIEQQKRFVYNIEPGITCCGDSSSIRQLFTILLDNAFKYSSDCGKIDFCLKKSGNNIIIQVKNDVNYIEENQTQRMFDRFYRSDATTSKVKGYGLGLSIAQAVVLEHKGNISAKAAGEHEIIINAAISCK